MIIDFLFCFFLFPWERLTYTRMYNIGQNMFEDIKCPERKIPWKWNHCRHCKCIRKWHVLDKSIAHNVSGTSESKKMNSSVELSILTQGQCLQRTVVLPAYSWFDVIVFSLQCMSWKARKPWWFLLVFVYKQNKSVPSCFLLISLKDGKVMTVV